MPDFRTFLQIFTNLRLKLEQDMWFSIFGMLGVSLFVNKNGMIKAQMGYFSANLYKLKNTPKVLAVLPHVYILLC